MYAVPSEISKYFYIHAETMEEIDSFSANPQIEKSMIVAKGVREFKLSERLVNRLELQ